MTQHSTPHKTGERFEVILSCVVLSRLDCDTQPPTKQTPHQSQQQQNNTAKQAKKRIVKLVTSALYLFNHFSGSDLFLSLCMSECLLV